MTNTLQTKKLVIGLVGEKGSGKETFVSLLKKQYSEKTVVHIRSSDILAETLKLWSLPKTRHNLQQLAIVMDQGFGLGTLTHAVRQKIDQIDADIVVYDGMRWLSDEKMVRSFSVHMLVYITAAASIRYTRTKDRKEKIGEAMASYEQFLQEEQVATELDIAKIGGRADVTIVNEGGVKEFEEKIKNGIKIILN